jgi:D-sedoheptulose 7-phosphate isomerase
MNSYFFSKYFTQLSRLVLDVDHKNLHMAAKKIHSSNKKGGKVIIVGNGGSAGIANHATMDFTKVAGYRAVNFNESSTITCLANDYGYENWVKMAIKFYADKNDVVILISSSGKSKNIINAAKMTKKMGINLITFSGFSKNNQLKKLGDLNFWTNSKHYNNIENSHQLWLLSIIDYLIYKKFK